MLRAPLILLITLLAAYTAAGRTMDVHPGELAAASEWPGHESVLTITGQLDASDLDRLAERLTDVETLDLSGAEIVAYKGSRIGANITSAPAATLPAGILAGLRVSRLILPETLTAIGDCALAGSTITELTVPGKVTRIGRSAFAGCVSLRTLTMPQSLTAIPDGLAEGCEALSELHVPDGVTKIGKRAFFGCKSLTSFSWPVALTTLGEEAFALSGLCSADLSRCASLTAIGARTFAHCQSLSSALLPDAAAEMGQGVFFECKSLAAVSLPASAISVPPLMLKGAEGLTELSLPEGTEVIDTLALAGVTGVAAVKLPASLNYIAEGAFEDCTGLTNIDASLLTAVPSLGDGVWAGVTQSDITLTVIPSLENAFLTTPQWQEFSIVNTSGLLAVGADAEHTVTAGFEGMTLTVTSAAPLGRIELYAVDGRLLTATSPNGTEVTRIDTSAYAGPYFMVRVTAEADSRPVTFKLLRLP